MMHMSLQGTGYPRSKCSATAVHWQCYSLWSAICVKKIGLCRGTKSGLKSFRPGVSIFRPGVSKFRPGLKVTRHVCFKNSNLKSNDFGPLQRPIFLTQTALHTLRSGISPENSCPFINVCLYAKHQSPSCYHLTRIGCPHIGILTHNPIIWL